MRSRQVALDFKPRYYLLIVRFDEQKIPFKIHPASRDRADALANLPSRARWFPRKRDVAVPATKRDLSHASALLGVEPKEGFSNENRSGHCGSYPISDGRARTLARRIWKRLGYKNIAKGIRRIDALCDGDLEGTKQFLDVLPQALETSAETVKRALEQTVRELELAEKQEAEARDKIWRENFRPHGVILTEKTVPSPIFVAAMIGVEKLLRIDLDATQGPVSFVRQVLDRLPEGVPAFGKPVGFVINYSPNQAVRFDPNGQPIAILDKPSVQGPPFFSVLGGGRSLPGVGAP
jgi:hypothetical protein